MDHPFLELFGVGVGLGQALLRKSRRVGLSYFILMGCLLVVFLCLILLLAEKGKINLLFKIPMNWVNGFFDPRNATSGGLLQLGSLVLVGLGYLFFFSLVSSPLMYLIQKRGPPAQTRLKKFSHDRFRRGRRKSRKDVYFAGIDAQTGEDILIDDESRMMHTQIVGVTGASKTEGGIIPPLCHDIIHGRGAIVIDMKGDMSLLDKVWTIVCAAGREQDFLFFSVAYPELSDPYNPLFRGNPNEKKDKIVSSFVFRHEFYEKIAERAVLYVLNAYRRLGKEVTFRTLRDVLNDTKSLRGLGYELVSGGFKDEITPLVDTLGGSTKDLAGLLADLSNIVDSDFGKLLDLPQGKIDLLDVPEKNKIVFFHLPTGLYQQTSERFGRMVIQDIKAVLNFIQLSIPEEKRNFFGVFIDEFGNLAYPASIEFLNKGRSAKIAIVIAHQSLGDLNRVNEYYKTQVFENTNIRLVFRQNDPGSVNLLTQMAGTVEDFKMTRQTENLLGGEMPTGLGSERLVEKFRIDPNIVRTLERGCCALMDKNSDRICYMRSDYIRISPLRSFLEDRIKTDLNKEAKELRRAPVRPLDPDKTTSFLEQVT